METNFKLQRKRETEIYGDTEQRKDKDTVKKRQRAK